MGNYVIPGMIPNAYILLENNDWIVQIQKINFPNCIIKLYY